MKEIDKFIDAIREAQNLAIKENITANAIVINEKYVKIAPWIQSRITGGMSIMPPMICGLNMHFTIDELPDNYSFAILENPNRPDKSDTEQAVREFADKILKRTQWLNSSSVVEETIKETLREMFSEGDKNE